MTRKFSRWLIASAGAVLMTSLALSSADARQRYEMLGGQLEVTGFATSEVRTRVSNQKYISQMIQKLQIEASMEYEEVGFFDELSFVTIIRPEFDLAYYYGDDLTGGHVGRNGYKSSYLGTQFDEVSDPVGYNGFGAALSTGGLLKNFNEGLWTRQEIAAFETIANHSTFPLASPIGQQTMNCHNCRDVDDSATDVALGRTGSGGDLYPFRELYVDAIVDDWWFRVGKQQIVWGKTDFFRMQDIINPVDFGRHFFFDSFEDIRIPQWIASAQIRPGSFGPLHDTALQMVWNFDKFHAVGLGNPSEAWAHPFGKEKGVFALFNTYFSPEPCVSTATYNATLGAASNVGNICQQGDGRLASGFGIPLGLSAEKLPKHKLKNTEFGGRFEFRLHDFRFALSHYYGWTDTPVFRIDTVNVNTTAGVLGPMAGTGIAADNLVVGLVDNGTGGAIQIPVEVMNPDMALSAAAALGDVGALAAQAQDNARLWYQTGQQFGGQTTAVYDRVNTTGLSVDYFEQWSGLVFRIESSYSNNELVNNTKKANWIDKADVVRWSVGLDRPTFIPILNKDRTFFLSAQFFDTWYLDHEGGQDGMFVGKHNYIITGFAQTHYMRDQLIPQAFGVWEEETDSWVAGFQVEYLFNNYLSMVVGGNFIWAGSDDKTFDVGPFASFAGNFAEEAVFGFAKQGIGSLAANDELFFRTKIQF